MKRNLDQLEYVVFDEEGLMDFRNVILEDTYELPVEDVHDKVMTLRMVKSKSEIEKVIVSGPKRELIEKTNLDWHHAAPGGDVMMTGTVGLIKTILG